MEETLISVPQVQLFKGTPHKFPGGLLLGEITAKINPPNCLPVRSTANGQIRSSRHF